MRSRQQQESRATAVTVTVVDVGDVRVVVGEGRVAVQVRVRLRPWSVVRMLVVLVVDVGVLVLDRVETGAERRKRSGVLEARFPPPYRVPRSPW